VAWVGGVNSSENEKTREVQNLFVLKEGGGRNYRWNTSGISRTITRLTGVLRAPPKLKRHAILEAAARRRRRKTWGLPSMNVWRDCVTSKRTLRFQRRGRK